MPVFLIIQPILAVFLVLIACVPLKRPGRQDGRPATAGPLDRLLAHSAREALKQDQDQEWSDESRAG